ncbi:SRPBCC family protein [Flavihumibacter sp. R14]|nr:SRPBCC family protein [Flavihumibacter soli]
MDTYYFHTEQFLPIDIATAWDFFSSAKNLALITPPELDFKILTQLKGEEIYEGMIIDYTVKPLFGIPLRWQTEITKVNKPTSFTDRQVKGPYKLWEHRHIYLPQEKGLVMQDEVKYQLPFGIIGRYTNSLVVREKIADIFAYRKGILNKMFVDNESSYH